LIRSPSLLDLALQLHVTGIDIEVTGQTTELLRRRLAEAVDDLIALFVERSGARFAGQAPRRDGPPGLIDPGGPCRVQA
jgi:hypothetical protein